MRCPTLAELPPPPPGKTGWPWTEETPPALEILPDGSSWPRVTIVTPSYNQGQYLEETIRSVLLQGYPDLEYIIIDGGSTDDSVEIIKKYEFWLGYWVSEPDRGQADAVNKGFRRATGEILGWINSDDLYEPGAFCQIARYFIEEPACQLLYGNGWYIDSEGHKIRPITRIRPFDRELFLSRNFILQHAAFWRKSLREYVGDLDIRYNWAMDWDWLLRATQVTEPHYLRTDLGRWRMTHNTKTATGGMAQHAEIAEISRKYGGVAQPTYVIYQFDRLAHWVEQRLGRGRVGRLPQYPLTALRLVLRRVYAGKYHSAP